MTGIVWCNTFIEGTEQLERIEEQYKAMGIKPIEKNKSINRYSIVFENEDYWKVVISTGNARGHKCNISYISRQTPLSVIQTIIFPCTRALPYTAYHYYGDPVGED